MNVFVVTYEDSEDQFVVGVYAQRKDAEVVKAINWHHHVEELPIQTEGSIRLERNLPVNYEIIQAKL